MMSFGLTFTDRQVLALFGSYDDDRSGALDYYEFLDKVLESDYKTEDGQAVTSCRPKTPERRNYMEQLDLYRQMVRLKEMYSYCCKNTTNRITVDEAREFLEECGHKEPEEDCVLQVVQATCPDTNGDLSFEQLWDWFVGTLEVPMLDMTPQYKVQPEKSGMQVLRDTQGRKHEALKKLTSSTRNIDADGDGELSAEEFKAFREKRMADVNHDGEVSQEELEEFRKRRAGEMSPRSAPRSPLWLGDKIPKPPPLAPSFGAQTSRPNTTGAFQRGGFKLQLPNRDGSGVKLSTLRDNNTNTFRRHHLTPRLPPGMKTLSKALTARMVRPQTCASGFKVCPETRFT